MRKFARKYRSALSLAGLFVGLVILAGAVSAWLAIEEERVVLYDDEGRRLRNLTEAEQARTEAEQGRANAEAKVRELQAELKRLRGET